MLNNKLTVHLFTHGDASDVNTWSGLPYYIRLGLLDNGVRLIISDISFPTLSYIHNHIVTIINRPFKRLYHKVPLQTFSKSILGFIISNLFILIRTIIYFNSDVNLFLTYTYGWSDLTKRTALLCDQTYTEAIARAKHNSIPYSFSKARLYSQSLALKRAKCIFATTQSTISHLNDNYSGLSVYPKPIRLVKSNQYVNSSELDSSINNRNTLLFIGSDAYYRGLDILLAAFKILQEDFPKLRLVIIGCGDSELIPQYKLDTNNIIHYPYLDKSKEEELALYTKFLKEASLFVMPQRGELLAGAMSESLRFGTPVITTNVKGMNIFIQHDYNGLLLSDPEPYLFAIAIKELLLDVSKLKTMSSNAIKSVQNLSPKNAAAELISASLQAIKKKRR